MEKKLIDLHWEWMMKKQIPDGGLCVTLFSGEYYKTLKSFFPNTQELAELKDNGMAEVYWGSETKDAKVGTEEYFKERYEYTTIRQTIVLFICAMHGEI